MSKNNGMEIKKCDGIGRSPMIRFTYCALSLGASLALFNCGGNESPPEGAGDTGGDRDVAGAGDAGGDGDLVGDGDITGDGDVSGDGDHPSFDGQSGTYFMVGICFTGVCLGRTLPVNDAGNLACTLLEATTADVNCTELGRTNADEGATAALYEQLEATGRCGGASGIDCGEYNVCVIPQLTGESGDACANDPAEGNATGDVGYCSITDPDNPRLADCYANEKKQLRASGNDVPLDSAVTFLACSSSTGGSTSTGDPTASLGTVCTAQEQSPDFGGHYSGAFDFAMSPGECGAGICLANAAQGRVGCPYGQDPLNPVSPTFGCETPSGEEVTAEVWPQIIDRRADDHVYCSCRCAGPDANADYCECPDGFECEELVPELGLGSDIVGSYCIKAGTAFDPSNPPFSECDEFSENCE